jgi:PAS domain S-box-containing protein
MIKKVLIVDDNSTSLYMLEALLKGHGFEVISAENGEDALAKARLNPPDLIVTDILMPVMDGFTLCREWKSDDTLKHIPLVFYTATYTEPKDEAFALSLGADRFILKPQEPETLIQILKEVREERSTAGAVAPKPLGEEMEFFRQHNEILFKKLEKKMSDLEISNQNLRLLEEQYQLSFEHVMDVIYSIDTDLNVSSVSPSVETILGYKPQDFIGRPVSDLGNILTPESFEQAIADLSLILKGETIQAMVYRFIAKDGSIKYGEVSGSPIMRDGKIMGVISVARDITDRKLAEEALRKSEQSLASIYNTVGDIIFHLAVEPAGQFRFVSVNSAFLKVTGLSPEMVVGRTVNEIIPEPSLTMVLGKYRQAIAENTIVRWEEISDYPTGRLTGIVSIAPVFDDKGTCTHLVGSVQDITERKQMEEVISQSEERYRTILDEMENGYFEVDLAGNYTFVNDADCRHLGYSREELLGLNFRVAMVKEDIEVVYGAFNNIYITGKPQRGISYKAKRKDGTTGFAEVSGFPLKNKKGDIIGFRGIALDVTERKRVEDALRESEEKYRTILEDMDDVYFEVDIKGNITFVNRSSCKMSGYSEEELLGMSFKKISIPDGIEMVMQYFGEIFLTSKTGKPFLWNLMKKNGEQGFFELVASLIKDKQGNPIGFRGIGRDITERKHAEEKLQQTLESLKKAVGTTIQVLVSAVESRDPYTAGHQLRVADLARTIATEIGLSHDKIEGIRMAGSIHDIGKLSIPAEILSKPAKLTNTEFSLIKEHPQIGYEMLKDVESPWPLAQIVFQHHERMNGSGYPRNLKGDEILLEARIMAVADVMEAMASHRPYRPSLGIKAALEEIEKNKGILYENAVADACLRLFREKGYQFK